MTDAIRRFWTDAEDEELMASWDRWRAEGVQVSTIQQRLSRCFGRSAPAIKARRDHLLAVAPPGTRRTTCAKCGQGRGGKMAVGPTGYCAECLTEAEVRLADPRPRVLLGMDSEVAAALGVRADGTVRVLLRLPDGDVEASASVDLIGAGDVETAEVLREQRKRVGI